jgi:molybdate transport system substrate-binding protein
VRRAWLLPLLVVAAGCGGGGSASLRVSAASSLKPAFAAIAGARFSFAGSDQLAAQIRAGARPDVFAAANSQLPDDLFQAGLVERPVAFAGNRLVIAVPPGSAIRRIEDLAQPGVAIATGAPTVPVGSYTLAVLASLPDGPRKAILRNIRSREPDVAGVIGKLTEGAVDAGFVYATDVTATKGSTKAVELPASLRPDVIYEAAVVKGSKHVAAARAFIARLRSGSGAAALRAAGFTAPR